MTRSRAVTPLVLLLVNVSSAIKIAVIPSTVGSSVMLSELLCLLRLVEIKGFLHLEKYNAFGTGPKIAMVRP